MSTEQERVKEIGQAMGRLSSEIGTLFMMKDCRIEELTAQWNEEIDGKDVTIARLQERHDQLVVLVDKQAALITDAFKVFDRYLNVPEAHELRDRWAKLKAQ